MMFFNMLLVHVCLPFGSVILRSSRSRGIHRRQSTSITYASSSRVADEAFCLVIPQMLPKFDLPNASDIDLAIADAVPHV